MESEKFKEWLGTTVQSFLKLSDIQKCSTINSLVEASGPMQLRYLSDLQHLMRRDFLKWLPLELSYKIISWLDADALKTCCLVSKCWNKVVNGCGEVWLGVCRQLGLNKKYEVAGKSANYWKRLCMSFSKKLKALNNGKAFSIQVLKGHTDDVTALHFSNGYLASGSHDATVRIWNVDSGECEHKIQTHSCADIKLYENTVATASYDCTVGLWDIKTASSIRVYLGHTSAVMSVDVDVEDQLLASGSIDKTVKIWDLKSNKCYKTFCHESWISKVILKRCSVDAVTHGPGDLVLLGKDEFNIKIWPITGESKKCLGTLNVSSSSRISEKEPLLSFMQFNGAKIVCTCGSAVHVWNFENLQYERFIIPEDQVADQLLGYGSTFIINVSKHGFFIRRRRNQRILANITDKRYLYFLRKRSACSLGDTAWLDGWGPVPESGLIFAASVTFKSIYMIKWV